MQTQAFRFLSVALVTTIAFAGCAATDSSDAEIDENSSDVVTGNFSCADDVNALGTSSGPTGVIKAVRSAGHPGFDRVVMEFTAGGVAEYALHRHDSATFSWGENEIPLSGTAGILLAVNASMYNGGWSSPESGTPFTGPLRFKPNSTSVVAEAAHLGEFEGMHDWGLGLKQKSCYRISKLENPPRLVIDVRAQ